MSSQRAQPSETLHQVFEKLGMIDGSVREMKHAANGLAMKVEAVNSKVDTLSAAVIKQDEIRRCVANLQETCREHDGRLESLETDRHRREGAIGLVEWISKHWPFALFAAALGALVVWANGKIG